MSGCELIRSNVCREDGRNSETLQNFLASARFFLDFMQLNQLLAEDPPNSAGTEAPIHYFNCITPNP
jgi:hypothetical protein